MQCQHFSLCPHVDEDDDDDDDDEYVDGAVKIPIKTVLLPLSYQAILSAPQPME